MADDAHRPVNKNFQALRRVWRFGARLDVAATLIFVVLLLAALGSCFPQLSPVVTADAEWLAQWQKSIHSRYGALTSLLRASGAFYHFSSPVFVIPVALLAVATLVCTLNRWRGLWRRAWRRPAAPSDARLDAAPHTAILALPTGIDTVPVVRQGLARRGFRVQATPAAAAGAALIHLQGERNRLAPLATLVTHLAILLLLLGAVLSSGYGWREEITIDPGQAAKLRRSGLTLRNEGFTITRHPDGSVAGYGADVSVAGAKGMTRGSVRVNEPLRYGPVSLHLRGYGGTEGRLSVTLLAVYDPGYTLVVVAGFLLLLGLSVSFNLPHCRIHARIGPDGTLRLAGRADRQAWDFEHEFQALVEEIEREI